MTTSNRMGNFKRLAERFSQGEKLLTTQEKLAIMATIKGDAVTLESGTASFPRVRLVLRASKKHIPH